MFSELGLLFVIVIVAILLYTSLIFAIETEGSEAWRWSFYDSFWWGLMTLTTVGYDMNPSTFMGKFICGMCAVTGIFILTLPIPIVVTSFAACYKNRLWRNEISMKKRLVTTSGYNARDDKLAEKRNLFPELAGAGGLYIPKEQDRHSDSDGEERSSFASFALSPSTTMTNGDCFSPFSGDENKSFLDTNSLPRSASRQATETSFMVEGTVEEGQSLIRQTDV